MLDFVGVKGRTYTLSVEDKNHRVQSQDVTIPANAGAEQNIDLVFGDKPNADKNPGETLLSITAHVFKQDDNLSLSGAAVTIIGLQPDQELKADHDGNVTFTVPEGEAYLIMANRDSYRSPVQGPLQGPLPLAARLDPLARRARRPRRRARQPGRRCRPARLRSLGAPTRERHSRSRIAILRNFLVEARRLDPGRASDVGVKAVREGGRSLSRTRTRLHIPNGSSSRRR